jgi:polysaccharide deacetylase family protein (PEP-CTERM system associated)
VPLAKTTLPAGSAVPATNGRPDSVRAPAERGAPEGVRPRAAFTVDVEDWYQSCVDVDAPITSRVVANSERVLAALDEFGVKGTFFVQGLVAEAFPALVSMFVREGHEVQSHGYSHRPLFAMTRRELRDELERARGTVEDAAGTRVTAFRAQDFSIVTENLWALDMLAEMGFTIDSSIFPLRTKRYGIAGWDVAPRDVPLTGGGSILEVPVAVWGTGRWRIPVAGGGYFRVLPAQVLERGLSAVIAEGRPAVIYCHPYEFNAHELDEYRGLAPARLLRAQGAGRRRFPGRIRRLLGTLPFGRFDDVVEGWRGLP